VRLKGNLLRGMIEVLIAEPNAVLLFPDGADIAAAMAQEKALDAPTDLAHVFRCGIVSANEITHRLIRFVWYPHGREFARARSAGERHGIASIRLDAVARASWRVSGGRRHRRPGQRS